MDLRSQPRKELIVNEIIVMKDSQHANIVNFLDSFLQEQSNELWVVMEFMEGAPSRMLSTTTPLFKKIKLRQSVPRYVHSSNVQKISERELLGC